MWPHELNLGPLAVNLYGLMVALGVVGGLALTRLTAGPAGTSFKEAFDLAFWLVVAGLAGARAAFVATHLAAFLADPARIPRYWEGGLMFQGGLLAGLALAAVMAARGRIRLRPMGDALAPALALGQGLGRLGCLMAGCCYGRPAPRALGLVFPRASQAPWGVPLYPTQLMESLALLALAAVLVTALRRRPSWAALPLRPPRPGDPFEREAPLAGPARAPTSPPGRILAWYLIWAGVIRLVMEFFRGDDRGPRLLWDSRPTAWAALALMAAGLWLSRSIRKPPPG